MIFAQRTNWQFEQNRLSQMTERLQARDVPILDLTCTNPTQVHLSRETEQMLSIFSDASNSIYASDSLGDFNARKAVAQYYNEHGASVDPSQIILTASTSEAYSFLFRLLMDPDDAAFFPRPSYPLFELLTAINDVDLKTYQLFYRHQQWELDRGSLACSRYKQPKAVIIVNPNNPTGSFLSVDDEDLVYQFCKKNNAAVICDEVFLDYTLDDRITAVSLAARSDHLTFVLGGLSKTLGLPQMKLSWIVVNGPDGQRDEVMRRLEMIADIYLSVNTPSQNALPYWLSRREEIQDCIRKRVRSNFSVISSQCCPGIECLAAQAGWSAVLKLPDGLKEEDFCLDLLQHDHVYVYPGYFFDFETEPFIVVSLLPEENIFRKGIEKIMDRVGR